MVTDFGPGQFPQSVALRAARVVGKRRRCAGYIEQRGAGTFGERGSRVEQRERESAREARAAKTGELRCRAASRKLTLNVLC